MFFAFLALSFGVCRLAAPPLFRLTHLVRLTHLGALPGGSTRFRSFRLAGLEFGFAARGIGFAPRSLVGLLLLLDRPLQG